MDKCELGAAEESALQDGTSQQLPKSGESSTTKVEKSKNISNLQDTVEIKAGKKPVPEFCLPVKSEEDVLEEQAQAMRASVYDLLAALLVSRPEQSVLDALAELGDVEAEASEIAMGWALLKQAALRSSQKDIEDEYFSLFVGVGRGELVPHGSWYMTGFLMEKPVAVLRRDLNALGIVRDDGVRKSEDHIAALCNAMALLIRNSDEISFERQKQFYMDHLEPWVKTFFADLQQADAAHFYRAVGFFGESIAKFEKDYFAMQV